MHFQPIPVGQPNAANFTLDAAALVRVALSDTLGSQGGLAGGGGLAGVSGGIASAAVPPPQVQHSGGRMTFTPMDQRDHSRGPSGAAPQRPSSAGRPTSASRSRPGSADTRTRDLREPGGFTGQAGGFTGMARDPVQDGGSAAAGDHGRGGGRSGRESSRSSRRGGERGERRESDGAERGHDGEAVDLYAKADRLGRSDFPPEFAEEPDTRPR